MTIPKSRNTGQFLQENTGNQWNLEAVFRQESLRIFSGDFRLASSSFRQETLENDWEKIQKVSGRNTAFISVEFRPVPVVF